jgi:hypothetical protein
MERFEIKVSNHGNRKPIGYYIDEKGCWICDSHKDDNRGYPEFHYNKKTITIHRYMYMVYINGGREIPKGLCVCHTCDNPRCINPEHLFIGTQQDNIRDMVNKGRNRSNRSLSDNQVKQIRLLHEQNPQVPMTQIALLYKVKPDVIYKIISGKSYRKV